ncbi:MAG TPA: formyltransferase family protein [Cyclobacteriaceae bacterium]|jgi:methionyl-tRNA formyltransferase|nr:formyltransferase family protein [Cyclobacteriaceae bacterium]
MNIVIANSNPIYRSIEEKCKDLFGSMVFTKKDELTTEALQDLNPDFVFFLHWSYIIPKEIHRKFKCVVFHMTDLPFGRGGSPLQNLIIRGFKDTVISAIRVEEGIDTGPVFLKKGLQLTGSAEEIFIRAGAIMFDMIQEIIDRNLIPVPQVGEVTLFKRRTPSESNVQFILEKEKMYDMIRMLDADNYPKAFLETEFFKFEFSRASLKSDCVIAEVKIIPKS